MSSRPDPDPAPVARDFTFSGQYLSLAPYELRSASAFSYWPVAESPTEEPLTASVDYVLMPRQKTPEGTYTWISLRRAWRDLCGDYAWNGWSPTVRITPATARFASRSVSTGACSASATAAIKVPPHVRKSLAVNSSPMYSAM